MATAESSVTKKEFDDAKNFKLFFGKYKGMTYNEIASDDDGLTYLDWLVGQQFFGDDSQYPENRKRYDALVAFLTWPVVARDLEAALRNKTK